MDGVALLFGISAAAVACLFAVTLNLGAAVRMLTGTPAYSGLGQRYSKSSALGRVLVASQLCIAMVVANVAAETGRSLIQVETRPLGYNPRNVLAMRINFDSQAGQKDADAVAEFARTLPGVEGATYAYPRPAVKEFVTEFSLRQGSRTSSSPAVRRDAAASYFRVMGIPLLRGRLFNPAQDVPLRDVIVNAAFVKAYSERQEIVGRSVSWTYTGQEKMFQVIGVVGDCIEGPLERANPTVYFSTMRGVVDLLVRTKVPQGVLRPLGDFVRRTDPNASVSDIETLENAIQAPLGPAKMQTFLAALFALASILVASAGLYGIVQHASEARRQEYAIHIAVGATPSQLIRRRLGETLCTAGAGLGAGIALSMASGKMVAAMLFRVPAGDPAVLGLVATALLSLAMCAAYQPIKASAGIDPNELLRAN